MYTAMKSGKDTVFGVFDKESAVEKSFFDEQLESTHKSQSVSDTT